MPRENPHILSIIQALRVEGINLARHSGERGEIYSDNDLLLWFDYSKKSSRGDFFHGTPKAIFERLRSEAERSFYLVFILGNASTVILVDGGRFEDMFSNVRTDKRGNYKYNLYATNERYFISVPGKGRFDLSPTLNKYELLGLTSEQKARVLSQLGGLKLPLKASEPMSDLKDVSLHNEKPAHDSVRDMIKDIGEYKGMVADTEFSFDGFRIDCVWRSLRKANPKYVFEVQFHGDFFKALAALKHAWDLYNSRPFLVTTEEYEEHAKDLLEGSFHEMRKDMRIVNWRRIMELHKHRKSVIEIERGVGFE